VGSIRERRPASGRELIGWIIIVLGTGAMQLPALVRMGIHGIGIMKFEFMYTSAEAARQLATLGPDGIEAAREQLFLDYAFLVAYGIALWKACHVLGARAERCGYPTVARLAPIFAWVAVAGAVCDAVENVGLLLVTYGHTEQPWPAVASGYATTKFVLLDLTLIFLLVAFVATVARRGEGPADIEQTQTG
jgi:hypothetical protein